MTTKEEYKKRFDLVVKDIHEKGKSVRYEFCWHYNDMLLCNKECFNLRSKRFTSEEMQKLINAIYYYYEGCYLIHIREDRKTNSPIDYKAYKYNHPRVMMKRFIRWNKYEDILMFRFWCMIGGDSNNISLYNDDVYRIEESLTRAVKQRNVLHFKKTDIEPSKVEDNPKPCCTIM